MSPKELRRSERIKNKNNIAKKLQSYKKYLPKEVKENSQFMVIKPTQTTCKNCCSLINARGIKFNIKNGIFILVCKTCETNLLFDMEDCLNYYASTNNSRESDYLCELLLPDITQKK